MRASVLAAALGLLVGGCIVPTDPAKQAEEIGSIAAEGALLAHDAAEGDTTETFTHEHAEALRRNLAKLEPKVEVAELARLLDVTDAQLERLAAAPGDQASAARVERRLDEAAKRGEELAG
jgi:hypothetical protein